MGINFDNSTEEISTDGYLSFEDSSTNATLSSLVSGIVARSGYIHGLRVTRSGSTAIQIATGICVDDSRSFEIDITSPVTVSFSSSGAGGLDTGSIAGNTLYYIFVIADSNGINSSDGLISLSISNPTVPSGYNKKRRIGSILTNSSGENYFFNQVGEGTTRYMMYEPNPSVDGSFLAIVNTGTATSYAAVDCSGRAPTTTKSFYIAINHLNNSGSPAITRYRAGQHTETLFEFFSTAGSGLSVYQIMWLPCRSDATGFYYRIVSNVSPQVNVWLLGYTEDLEDI